MNFFIEKLDLEVCMCCGVRIWFYMDPYQFLRVFPSTCLTVNKIARVYCSSLVKFETFDSVRARERHDFVAVSEKNIKRKTIKRETFPTTRNFILFFLSVSSGGGDWR